MEIAPFIGTMLATGENRYIGKVGLLAWSTKRTEDDAGVEGDYHGGEAVPDQGNGRLVDRRDYLKLASAAAATAGMASLTSASTGTTRHGIEFDRVLDAVDDLGLDPTGNEPVNSRLDSALERGRWSASRKASISSTEPSSSTPTGSACSARATCGSSLHKGSQGSCSITTPFPTTCSSRTWISTCAPTTRRPVSGSSAGTSSTLRTSNSSAEGSSTTPGRSAHSSSGSRARAGEGSCGTR